MTCDTLTPTAELVLHILADECDGAATVREVMAETDRSRASVQRALALLETRGEVTGRKDGRETWYEVNA